MILVFRLFLVILTINWRYSGAMGLVGSPVISENATEEHERKQKTNEHCNFVFDPLLTDELHLSQEEIDFIFMVCRDAIHAKGNGAAMDFIQSMNEALAKEFIINRLKEISKRRSSTDFKPLHTRELHLIEGFNNNNEDQQNLTPPFPRAEE